MHQRTILLKHKIAIDMLHSIRTTAIFHTATNSETDLVNVKDVSDIRDLSNVLSVDPVWCIQSIGLSVNDGLTVTIQYFNVFYVSVSKTACSIQTYFLGLIAYFICNIAAKNYKTPFMYVKVIASAMRHSIYQQLHCITQHYIRLMTFISATQAEHT